MYKRFTITANPPEANEHNQQGQTKAKAEKQSSVVSKGANFTLLVAGGLCAGLALGWLLKRRNSTQLED